MEVIQHDIHYLYCPMKKKTNEFVTERYELTNNIFEAIGWETEELCKKDIAEMDEPKEWTIVIKIIEETAIRR